MRLLVLIFSIILSSCSTSNLTHLTKTLEFKSGNMSFKMIVPSTWTYFKSKGIDSFTGDINIGRQDIVHFDFGLYSNDLNYPLWTGGSDVDVEKIKKDEYFAYINGFKAKIVSHRYRNKSDLGVHFDNVSTENKDRQVGDDVLEFTMYGINISSVGQRELRKAFQTIEFIQCEK